MYNSIFTLMKFIVYSFKIIILAIACFFNFDSIAQPTHFNPKGIGGGGAQFAPSINPANTNEMYVACDMSPLFHTLDGGVSWNVVDYHYIMANHATHVEFTNNPLIQYCMTNDANSGSYFPVKTTDGGTTWNPITDPTGGNGAWFTFANPQNSNQLIVTDYSNFYFSNNGGTTFGSSFYNNANGAYIAGTFWDGLNIYICTDIGLVTSTNGGTTWNSTPTMTGIPSTEQIVSFAGAKAGGITRFYCVTWSSGNVYPGVVGSDCGYFANVYTMDYGTSNWVSKINGITAGTDDLCCVGMASNNINVAYIAGENSSTSYPVVLKTLDAGTTWTHNFNTANNLNIQTAYCGSGGDFQWTWAQYIYGISVAANDPNKVIFCDMGFTHKTTDGGASWQAAYVAPNDLHALNTTTPSRQYYHGNGIEPTACWDITWASADSIYAGYTDIHGVRSNNGGTTWGFDYSGLNQYNTVYKFLKGINGTIYAATSSIHDMYESTHLIDSRIDNGTGEVMFSINNGATFTTLHNFGKPVIWIAFDPTTPNRMYASVINHAGSGTAGGIWKSDNINLGAASTWAICPRPARTQGHPFNIRVLNDGTVVSSFSGRRNTANTAFTDSSGVFISTDHGNTWIDRSDVGMQYWCMDVVIDPFDAAQNTWYAGVFSGWSNSASVGVGGVYRTTNRGVNWTRITTNYNIERAFSVTCDPVHQGAAYMTTETQGLWYTANIAATSPVWTQVSGYPFRQPNRVYFNPYNQNQIWVNSFGNGIRVGDLTAGINESFLNSNALKIYPNPATDNLTIELQNSNIKQKVEIIDISGKTIYSSYILNKATINISKFSKGVYTIKVYLDKNIDIKKFVKE